MDPALVQLFCTSIEAMERAIFKRQKLTACVPESFSKPLTIESNLIKRLF